MDIYLFSKKFWKISSEKLRWKCKNKLTQHIWINLNLINLLSKLEDIYLNFGVNNARIKTFKFKYSIVTFESNSNQGIDIIVPTSEIICYKEIQCS